MGNLLRKCCCKDEVIVRSAVDPKNIVADWTGENTPWFNLDGYQGPCRVIDVYDGDTITIAILFCDKIFKTKCRLAGIDAAEIRTKNLEEKKHGLDGKEYLQTLIANKFIWCRIGKNDKYGRPLGVLYLTEHDFNLKQNNINDDLVAKNFAYSYDGTKKTLFEDWKKDEKD